MVRGAQTITLIHSVVPFGSNAGEYSLMQTVIKVPNVILRYSVASILQPLSQIDNGCGSLWRKSKFPLHHVPYVFNWREIWGSCWPGQFSTPRRERCVAEAVCGRALSCWKSISPSFRRNDSSTEWTACAISWARFTLLYRNTTCDREL